MAINYKSLIWYSLGGLTVSLVSFIFSPVPVPKILKVAPGYVIPAKIEDIGVRDLNQDGKLEETIIRYKGKALLFKEKQNGGVEGNPFEINEKNY